jgi:uncharacterized repeat protein (TIGR01451 family)
MIAFAAEEIEWVNKLDGTQLYWGDAAPPVDGYVIKAEDFNEKNQVFVSISKDEEKLKTAPLSTGSEVVYDDRIKVYAREVNPNYDTVTIDDKEFKTKNWNPYAKLDIFVRGEPKFNIKVETRKDTYDSKYNGDSRIDVSMTLKNEGEAKAEDTVLTIDTAGMELLKGKPMYKLGDVLKGETLEPVNITLKAPTPWVDTDLNITAKTACVDVKNYKYEDLGYKLIKIEKKWGLIISKSIPRDNHMGKPIHVSISVQNNGLCDINDILLKDSIASEVHLQKDVRLEKTLALKSGESTKNVFEYTLIPDKPGEFTFPQTIADCTLPNGQSGEEVSNNSEKIRIYGPEISITKTIDRQQLDVGDELTVTVTAKNTGNADAIVTLTDTAPPETKFISGEMSSKQVIGKDGDSKTITYILKMNKEGEIHLPACKINFLDLDEYSGEVFSNAPVVYVGIPIPLEGSSTHQEGSTGSNEEKNGSSTNGGEEDSGDTPGFGIIPAIAGLLAVSGFLGKKHK